MYPACRTSDSPTPPLVHIAFLMPTLSLCTRISLAVTQTSASSSLSGQRASCKSCVTFCKHLRQSTHLRRWRTTRLGLPLNSTSASFTKALVCRGRSRGWWAALGCPTLLAWNACGGAGSTVISLRGSVSVRSLLSLGFRQVEALNS